MSIQQGNRGIVKKDLQLYYNREWARSFRGEATTNIAYATNNYLNSNGNWWTNSGATVFNDNDTSISKPVILNVDTSNLRIFSSTVTTAGGNQQLGSSIIPISPSTQYSMSIYYWFSGTSMQAAPYVRTQVNNNSLANFAYNGDTNYLNWPRRTWIRLTATFTTQANETGVYMSSYTGDTVGEKLAYFGYQLEQRAYVTPLVLGARSIATTNLLTSTYATLPTNWGVDGSGQGTIGTYSTIENATALRVVDVNSNTRFRVDYLTGVSASTTYTFSVKYRKVVGTPTLRFQIVWYNSSNVLLSYVFPLTSGIKIYDLDGWQLAQYTATSPANTSKLTWFIQDGDDYTTYTHTYDIKEPQIQTGICPSPWTATSYSANTLAGEGGLVDLSGNSYNVNLPNVSFDSGGYYFNGSSNYIDLGSDIVFKSSGGWSVSSWFNLTQVVSGNLYNFIGASAITYNSWYWTVYQSKLALWNISPGGWYYGSTTIQANTWYNAVLVCSYDGTKYQMYLNGVAEGGTHTTYTWNSDYSGLKVGYVGRGDSSNGRYFYGKYPIIQIYNRALTSDEILQNFNANKTAYGL